MTAPARFRIIGPGRAGGSLGAALEGIGWRRLDDRGRGDDLSDAADGVDLVVIAVPDGAITDVSAAIAPRPDVVIAHLAGSLGVDVLAPHRRRGALHPLVALPDVETGARRLRTGTWFAVAGDPLMRRIARDLGGRHVVVDDADRVRYHAAAAVASNHLVALLGQVERLAGTVGVPLEAYLALVRATVDNVASLGAADALTGPVARGDWETVAAHLAAMGEADRAVYRALATEAAALAGRSWPDGL